MNKKKIIILILIMLWMIGVFMFSDQGSDQSTGTSGKTIGFIIDSLSITKNMNEIERQELIETLQPLVRKLAHFTIYTIGGILAYAFVNEYNTSNKKKFLYSVLFCFAYAITDELHQVFVPGRSGEVRDVLIDTSGAALGTLITYGFIMIFQKNKKWHIFHIIPFINLNQHKHADFLCHKYKF